MRQIFYNNTEFLNFGQVTACSSAEIADTPSGLLKTVVEPLDAAGIHIDYFYAFLEPEAGTARIVLKTSDDEKAESLLNSR